MNTTATYLRIFFILLSLLFFCAFTTTSFPGGFTPANIGLGLLLGGVLSAFLIGLERVTQSVELRVFNLITLGLIFGYLLGQALSLILGAVLDLGQIGTEGVGFALVKVAVYLFTCYLGVMFTFRSSEEIHLSIPYVKFQPAIQKKKDIILDAYAVLDTRMIDLASSGLLDNQLIVPRFILKELYKNLESVDESQKGKARRALDIIKKLEGMSSLGLRYVETDFPEISELDAKTVRLARLTNSNILTADQNRIKQSTIESTEGVRMININHLASSLKPLSQTGTMFDIKIQREGKDPGQGVGYLEDGTMVVVNGGGPYIGKTIKCHFVSLKHTQSGRMIFCNACEDDESEEDKSELPSRSSASRSYFALER